MPACPASFMSFVNREGFPTSGNDKIYASIYAVTDKKQKSRTLECFRRQFGRMPFLMQYACQMGM
jgi:hypothetical protein